VVPLASLEQYADKINLISLTMDNQKNGQRGDTLSHHAIQHSEGCCPVKALVARTLDMLRMGAHLNTLICAFKEVQSMDWQFVRSADIVRAVKDTAIALRLPMDYGYPLSKLGSHSLRAGGAMALYLNHRSTLEIQRAGRWTSDTFLEYIHCQLDASSRGLAQAMSKPIQFMNMAG